ncbi:MAG: TerB family tellurite resistance protein [Vulcanimicrobiota bacterium]
MFVNDDTGADVPYIAAALAVSLIASDGVIEAEEKEVAVRMGHRMLPGFSAETFEKVLADLDDLPSAYELASSLHDELDAESKDTIMDYLAAIASADNVVVEVEEAELEAVADALGVPMPPLRVAKAGGE